MTKRLSILIAAALAVPGCVTDQPLLVTGIHSLDPQNKGTCTASNLQQGGGSLDLAGGGSYLMAIDLQNDLEPNLDTKGDMTVLETGLHRNTVLLDTVTYTYTSVPTVTFVQESLPVTFSIPPSAGSPNAFHITRFPLFNRKALEKLYSVLDGTTNTNGVLDVRDVKVKIVFSGSVVSGGRISSTPITYPIAVYNSGFTCPTAGDTLGLVGPCGNPGGQDGARLCCASDPTCVIAK